MITETRGLSDEGLRLTPDVEQVEFAGFVTKFLAERCDETEVRRLMDDDLGYDRGVWAGLRTTGPRRTGHPGEVRRQRRRLPGDGGRDGGAGPLLGCLPFYATSVLAAGALLAGDDEQAREGVPPRDCRGQTIATVAAAETGRSSVSDLRTSAEVQDSGFVLTGSTRFVVDGCAADLLLVVAQSPSGLSLFALSDDAPGLSRTAMPTLDPTRKLARLTLNRATDG